MALRKAAAARIRLTVLGLVFIALAVFFFRNASNADTSPIRLASLYKDIPTGFSEEVQPNVLLLLDTSGSMTFRLDRNTSTYGDGTATFDGQQYYGNDVDSSNNDPAGRYNYHPNLLYIPTAQLPSSSQRSYLGGSHANDDPPEGYSSYKYPNDSRMYQLKLVLYDILNSPNLVSGLRIAMSTYWQSNDRVQSEWYTWPPTSDYNESWSYYYGYRYRQNISWDYSTNRNCATLREDFESTDDSTHLSDLIKWVDGMESSSNPELRANGHTPLAPSIYNTTSATDCALDYFKKSGTINAWCQDNWPITI
jgi:type IV pilus assembly protein PilY1